MDLPSVPKFYVSTPPASRLVEHVHGIVLGGNGAILQPREAPVRLINVHAAATFPAHCRLGEVAIDTSFLKTGFAAVCAPRGYSRMITERSAVGAPS